MKNVKALLLASCFLCIPILAHAGPTDDATLTGALSMTQDFHVMKGIPAVTLNPAELDAVVGKVATLALVLPRTGTCTTNCENVPIAATFFLSPCSYACGTSITINGRIVTDTQRKEGDHYNDLVFDFTNTSAGGS